MSKKEFVKQLYELVVQTPEWGDMKGMEYIVDEHGSEWLYVLYGQWSQYRININGDSTSGILEDFIKHHTEHDWLSEELRIDMDEQ